MTSTSVEVTARRQHFLSAIYVYGCRPEHMSGWLGNFVSFGVGGASEDDIRFQDTWLRLFQERDSRGNFVMKMIRKADQANKSWPRAGALLLTLATPSKDQARQQLATWGEALAACSPAQTHSGTAVLCMLSYRYAARRTHVAPMCVSIHCFPNHVYACIRLITRMLCPGTQQPMNMHRTLVPVYLRSAEEVLVHNSARGHAAKTRPLIPPIHSHS